MLDVARRKRDALVDFNERVFWTRGQYPTPPPFARSFNGRTAGFELVNVGSNPTLAGKNKFKGGTMFKFDLGQKVKDKVTGFSGVVVCRADYMTGCVRYSVQSKKLSKEGKPQDWQVFDEDQLIDLMKNINHEVKNAAGPQPFEHLLQR